MRRLFWLGVGVAVGALVVRQVTRAARAHGPASSARRAVGALGNAGAGLWESVQDFVADVREGMAEREEQIRAAFERGESLVDLGLVDDEQDPYRRDGEFGYVDELYGDDRVDPTR